MLLDLETLNEYNAICREDTGKAWAKVGNLILKTGGVTDMKVSPSNQDMAKNVVKSLFYKLLEAGRYDCAGTLGSSISIWWLGGWRG